MDHYISYRFLLVLNLILIGTVFECMSVTFSIQFKFICIALFMIQIVAKQLCRKLSFYNIFSSSLSVVSTDLFNTTFREI